MNESATASIDILVGRSWKVDMRYLSKLYSFRRGEGRFDYTDILDVVDIVIDGANVTSRLPEESIFVLMFELVRGLCNLEEGLLNKHIVAFQEAPWELAVRRTSAGYALSLYQVGQNRDVAVHNVDVDRQRFLTAVRRAAENLLDDLAALNRDFRSEETFQTLRTWCSKLRKTGRGRDRTPIVVPPNVGFESLQSGRHPLALRLDFDASHPDLWEYQGALDSDMHSLLFKGSARVAYWGKTRPLAENTYIFPVMDGLVKGAGRLLDTLERQTGGCVLLDGSSGAHSVVTAELLGPEQVRVRITERSGSIGQTRTTPNRLFTVLVDAVASFLARLIQLNPRQELNHCVVELAEEVDQLRSKFHHIRQGDVYFEEVQQFLKSAPTVRESQPRPGDESTIPFELTKFRHFFMRPAWFAARDRIDFKRISAIDDRLLVPSLKRLDCLDRRTGRVHWSLPSTRLLARADNMALLRRQLTVQCVELQEGQTRWTVELSRNADSGLLFEVGGQKAAVLIDEGSVIMALSATTGDLFWCFRLEHGELVGSVLAGPVLALVADDGFAYGLDATSGKTLWSVRIPGSCHLPPLFHEGRLYICADSDPGVEGVLYSLSPLTGRRRYACRIPASFWRLPSLSGPLGLLALETASGSMAAAVDLEEGRLLWRLALESAHVEAPTMSMLTGATRNTLLIKTDVGVIMGLVPETGELYWSTRLLEEGDILLANVPPALVADHIVAVERYVSILNPRTGRRLHRFADLPEQASWLHVDGDLSIILGDGEDHLEAFELSGFLALV